MVIIMEKIVESIKILAVNAVESQKPTTIMFGIAESDDTIMVEQRLRLQRVHLTFMKGAKFQAGDKVILLREHGGQGFVVLGALENKT